MMEIKLRFQSDGFAYVIVSKEIAKILWYSNEVELYKVYTDDSEALIEDIDELKDAIARGVMIGISVGRVIEKDVRYLHSLKEIVTQRVCKDDGLDDTELAKETLNGDLLLDKPIESYPDIIEKFLHEKYKKESKKGEIPV